MNSSKGNSVWWTADPATNSDQPASQSSKPSQSGEGNSQHPQLLVQHPGCGLFIMPVGANNFVKLPEEFCEEFSSYNRSCMCLHRTKQLLCAEVPRELVAVGKENRSYPLIKGNHSDKAPSPDEGCSSSGTGYYATYQAQPEPSPAKSQSENIDSPCEAGILEDDELGVAQEDLEVYRTEQNPVACPQPNPPNAPVQVQSLKYNNPPQDQDEIQVEQVQQVFEGSCRIAEPAEPSSQTPEDKNSVLDKRFKKQELELEDKPIECPLCSKQFDHKKALRRHKFNHSDSKPYECHKCSAHFSRNDHLLAHQWSEKRREKKLQENNKNQTNVLTENQAHGQTENLVR